MTTIIEAPNMGNLTRRPSASISELFGELQKRRALQNDIKVNTNDISMEPETGCLLIQGNEYEVRPHAFNQMATKLRIPASYLSRCDNRLRAENVNRWMREADKDLTVRTEGTDIRAILSDRYRPINHLDILDWMGEHYDSNARIRYHLDDTHMDVQVVKDEVSGNDFGGLHRGFHVRNSEVGASAVEISAMVYRAICLNGLIMNHGKWNYSRRHIGKVELLEEVHTAFDKAAVMAKAAADGMTGSRGIKVSEPLKAIKKLITRYELSDVEHKAVDEAYEIEPEQTLFGVINALTRAANNDKLNNNSRHSLQTVAGRVTELAAEGRWID